MDIIKYNTMVKFLASLSAAVLSMIYIFRGVARPSGYIVWVVIMLTMMAMHHGLESSQMYVALFLLAKDFIVSA